MKSIAHWLVLLMLLASSTTLRAEILVTSEEIKNLGIELQRPRATDRVSVIEAPARVVLPANSEFIVSTPQAGLLARLHVSIGDEVRQGDVLAEVMSEAFLMRQQEFLDAVIQKNLASHELTRDLQLFEEGIISKRRLQDTRARAAGAEAVYSEHRQLLRYSGLAESRIDLLANDQRLAETLVIHAPLDGAVLESMAVAGQHVEGMSALYRVADTSSLWLEILVPQQHLGIVERGMTINVTGLPDPVTAEVTRIGQALDTGSQTAIVRAELGGESPHLRPGQFVSVQVTTDTAGASSPVWAIPTTAVTRSGTTSHVFVRSSGGFIRRTVTVVGSDDEFSYVMHGVDPDSQIAVRGVAALKAQWAAEEDPDA